MAVVVLLGAIVGNLVIPIWELRRAGAKFKPSFNALTRVKKVSKCGPCASWLFVSVKLG